MSLAPSQILASRLRTAREEADLSQKELAQRLGVSQAAVSTWESGTRQPGVDDIYALAEALDVDVYDLLPRKVGPPLRAVLRAVAEDLEHATLAQAMEDFVDAAEQLGRPERVAWSRADAPEEAAAEVLEAIAIRDAPIDVELAANRCGVPVLFWPFDSALSGLAIDTAQGAVIGVNEDHAPNRQRFSIAHELGHVLLRHLDSFHVDIGTSAEDGNPPNYNWRHERAANDFAAALLMPAPLVMRYHQKTQSVAALAKDFEVSTLAMGFRLKNLGLTSSND